MEKQTIINAIEALNGNLSVMYGVSDKVEGFLGAIEEIKVKILELTRQL